jgi:hypothetical protein
MNSECLKEYCFVSIKGFGDLTIALSMLRRVPDPFLDHFSVLIGSHLKGLVDALNVKLQIRLVDVGSEGGAAIFALRTRGILAGLRNAIWLRSSVGAAIQNKPLTLVFDKLSWRERFMSAGARAVAIPPHQNNVYIAYEFFLKSLFPILPAPQQGVVTGKLVGIFPITSLNKKNLTATVINQITSICRSKGFDPVVFLLDGERLDGPVSAPIINIDRNFTALMGVIDSLAGAICADSLPAHLSAYLHKHVFVVSPTPNTYWFPQSVYVNDYWGLFKDVDALNRSLDKFFSSLSLDSTLSEKLNAG